jgi:type II secretory pathway component PulF
MLGYGYAPPANSVFDVATAIALIPWAFVLTILFAFLTPRFEEIFRDFGTRLPMVTVLLLQGSRAFLAYGWVAV